jgi:hypothetical protein
MPGLISSTGIRLRVLEFSIAIGFSWAGHAVRLSSHALCKHHDDLKFPKPLVNLCKRQKAVLFACVIFRRADPDIMNIGAKLMKLNADPMTAYRRGGRLKRFFHKQGL